MSELTSDFNVMTSLTSFPWYKKNCVSMFYCLNLGAYISFFVKVLIEKYDSVSNELNFSDFY